MTVDGRTISEVLTYQRRGGRLSPTQAAAWARCAPQWWIPDEAAEPSSFRPADWFGRSAPLIVEIGSGVGEATVALALARPTYDVLAFEVWRPGVAQTLRALERAGATNVRVLSVDAVWSLAHLVDEAALAELWTFFPDPWPKNRHRRRRLVRPDVVRLAASRLAPGALWRLATDWPPYAEQMTAVLGGEPGLEQADDRPPQRWAERPVTRFERRALVAGRPVLDLTYRRI